MKLLRDAQLLKIVMNVGPYYSKLLKEFVVNLPSGLIMMKVRNT